MINDYLTHLPHNPTFNNPKEEGFGKHCGKRRKSWQPAFSPFPTVFSTLSRRELVMLVIFNCLPKDKFLDWSKLKAFADYK